MVSQKVQFELDKDFTICEDSRTVNGRRQLRRYLDAEEDRTQVWLARTLRISEAYVSAILSGDRRPSLRVASEIEKLTDIPASAFAKVA